MATLLRWLFGRRRFRASPSNPIYSPVGKVVVGLRIPDSGGED